MSLPGFRTFVPGDSFFSGPNYQISFVLPNTTLSFILAIQHNNEIYKNILINQLQSFVPFI